MRRFYAPIDNFAGTEVTLDADETRHLRDVLRLSAGDEVHVFNGRGREFRCTIASVGKKTSLMTVIEEARPAAPESPLDLTLAAAMLKGDKFDLVVQKAVELGVTRIVPLWTVRCDVKLDSSAKRADRWRRIALEATKQSGRANLTQIDAPVGFEPFLIGAAAPSTVFFSERDGTGFDRIVTRQSMNAIVGPEGGWDDAELDLARSRGVTVVTLGGRILRAETAAKSVASVLQHRFGDLN
jgi:16S rRNA (uracil1498-N3)-methyltransferase